MESDESRRHEALPLGREDNLIAEKLILKIERHSVDGYIDKLNNTQKYALSASAVHELADYVMPIDPILGPDESHPGNAKFMIGGLIGLDVARHQLGKYIDRELSRTLVTLFQEMAKEIDGRNEFERRQNISEALLSAGHQAWLNHKAYYELTEQVEAYICPEIAHQSYLEAGMGIVLLAVDTIQQEREAERYKKDLERFADSLPGIHDVDWDNLPWDK